MPSTGTVDAEHTVAVDGTGYRGDGSLPTDDERAGDVREPARFPGGERVSRDRGHPRPRRRPGLVRSSSIRELARRTPSCGRSGSPATTASTRPRSPGMSSTSADWIVTMDEDGQHDPDAIGSDAGHRAVGPFSPRLRTPTNKALRRLPQPREPRRASRRPAARRGNLSHFHSYRLMLGEMGAGSLPTVARASTSTSPSRGSKPHGHRIRSRCATSGAGPPVHVPTARVPLLADGVDVGTRPLRLVALFGAVLGASAFGLMGWVVWAGSPTRCRSQAGLRSWSSCSPSAAERALARDGRRIPRHRGAKRDGQAALPRRQRPSDGPLGAIVRFYAAWSRTRPPSI